MEDIHCYNQECINGIALKNCSHTDCEDKTFFPQLLVRNGAGGLDSFYCERECKAKVVMVDYQSETKPRSVKEMVYRVGLMKQRYLETKTA